MLLLLWSLKDDYLGISTRNRIYVSPTLICEFPDGTLIPFRISRPSAFYNLILVCCSGYTLSASGNYDILYCNTGYTADHQCSNKNQRPFHDVPPGGSTGT